MAVDSGCWNITKKMMIFDAICVKRGNINQHMTTKIHLRYILMCEQGYRVVYKLYEHYEKEFGRFLRPQRPPVRVATRRCQQCACVNFNGIGGGRRDPNTIYHHSRRELLPRAWVMSSWRMITSSRSTAGPPFIRLSRWQHLLTLRNNS